MQNQLTNPTSHALQYIQTRYIESPVCFGDSMVVILRESSQLLVVILKWSIVCKTVAHVFRQKVLGKWHWMAGGKAY